MCVLDGWMDGWLAGWLAGWLDGQTDAKVRRESTAQRENKNNGRSLSGVDLKSEIADPKAVSINECTWNSISRIALHCFRRPSFLSMCLAFCV